MKKTKDIFIFVPAYNVEATLGEVLLGIPEPIRTRSSVLVVDDGSSDGTESAFFKVSASASDDDGSLQYKRFEKNSGYGAVVKYGIAAGLAAGAKYIACLHGDAQYPAGMLGQFVEKLECGDFSLVQGSRHAVAGEARRGGMPLYKRLGGKFLTFVENLTFRQKLTDRHSGYIVYSREFLKNVDLDKLSPSFDIDLELISIADANGFELAEIPIPTRYADEKSNLNVVSYGLRVLGLTLRRLFARK